MVVVIVVVVIVVVESKKSVLKHSESVRRQFEAVINTYPSEADPSTFKS